MTQNNSNNTNPVKILSYAIVLIITFIIGHGSAVYIYENSNASYGQNSNLSKVFGVNNDGDLREDDFKVFWEVYRNLEANYIDKDLPDEDELVEGATKGLISALGDRYTNYYSPDEWQEIQEDNSGKFDGIGIRLQMGEDGYSYVEGLIKRSPAESSGIKAGDWIIEVDGETTENLSITKVAERIRGEKGTEVDLKIYRPRAQQTLDFSVKRDNIDVDSIDYKKLDDGGVVISINKFTESSYSEFQEQWLRVVSEVNATNPKYIVLDLRNNSGGWVDAARFVLGEFVPVGEVVMREQDRDGNEEILKTDRQGKFLKTPMVVLVNGGTASASEIVAGALQDLNRAKLVGTPTLGKGVEQTVIATSDGGSVHIVFKKWLTPKGKNLSKDAALTPDKEVDSTAEDIKANRDPQLDEALKMVK